MRRIGVLAYLAVWLMLPASGHAATPPNYKPVGPPATLGAVAFASDGTVYGTVGEVRPLVNGAVWPSLTERRDAKPVTDPALWRSNDHGRTWSARYRAAPGVHLAVLAVAPGDADTVFASEDSPGHAFTIERIDAARGRAVPLAFDHFQGVDAAGTAYGIKTGPASDLLIRCPRAGECDAVPVPQYRNHAVVVDPKSNGVLTALAGNDSVAWLETSADAGASWVRGTQVRCNCSQLAFAGPAPRTLYAYENGSLRVSHDAGLTFSSEHGVPGGTGIVLGSQPAALMVMPRQPLGNGSVTVTGDEGVSFRERELPDRGAPLAVDPADTTHLFFVQDGRTTQSWDAGVTWSDVGDARFGLVALSPSATSGVGRHLYSVSGRTIWYSDDWGATWGRVQRPSPERLQDVLVTRDDPLTAYVHLEWWPGATIRTRDGGRTWEPVPGPGHVYGIVTGHPLHVISDYYVESLDGGTTWTQRPRETSCRSLIVVADATSSTGQRLYCHPSNSEHDPKVVSLPPDPATPGLVDAPDFPGAFAIVSGVLFGDVTKDGSWQSLRAASGGLGPGDHGLALSAWPARGGTTFLAVDGNVTWVRRGGGRWWRLQAGRQDVVPVKLLDSTHVLVTPSGTDEYPYDQGLPLAVIDLARPVVDPPVVRRRDEQVVCAVPWTTQAAETPSYSWLRDGAKLRGVTRGRYRPTVRDRGHVLTCSATAGTAWGSVTLKAGNAYRVPKRA